MTGFRIPRIPTPPRKPDSIDQRIPMMPGACVVPPTPHAARMGGCVTLAEFDWQDESADPCLPRTSYLALVRLDNWAALAQRLTDAEIRAAVRSWYTPARDSAHVHVRHDLGNGYFVLLIEERLTVSGGEESPA